jgi:hypothetical protein
MTGACGRAGFAPISDDASAALDGAALDATWFDAHPDAPPNAMVLMVDAVADTYVSQDTEKGDQRPNNFGGDSEIKIKRGEEHGLVRFELSDIPPTATVFSAELELAITSPAPGLQIGVHPVLEAWVEGALDGTPGQCNWTMRDPVNAWTTAGAAPPGSAGPVAATFAASAAGPVVVALPATTVQAWVASPGTNHGVLLVAIQDDGADLASWDEGDAPGPRLTVTWTP